MKGKWSYIKLIALIAVVVFLFGFANKRHADRGFSTVKVQFDGGDNRFLTRTDVREALKLKAADSAGQLKRVKNNLQDLETRLLKNRLVKNAEVYIGIDGALKTRVQQRKPIARILGKSMFYVDETGGRMPLSRHFAARVPLVDIAEEEKLDRIFPVLTKIHQDEFLSILITGLNYRKSGDVHLHLRNEALDVNFGKIEHVERKIYNLKAFYKKMQKNNELKNYKAINLTFENQVVATKK